jgi:hypothetical protein
MSVIKDNAQISSQLDSGISRMRILAAEVEEIHPLADPVLKACITMAASAFAAAVAGIDLSRHHAAIADRAMNARGAAAAFLVGILLAMGQTSVSRVDIDKMTQTTVNGVNSMLFNVAMRGLGATLLLMEAADVVKQDVREAYFNAFGGRESKANAAVHPPNTGDQRSEMNDAAIPFIQRWMGEMSPSIWDQVQPLPPQNYFTNIMPTAPKAVVRTVPSMPVVQAKPKVSPKPVIKKNAPASHSEITVPQQRESFIEAVRRTAPPEALDAFGLTRLSDKAMNTNGGIDLEKVNVSTRGSGVRTAFSDPEQLIMLLNADGLVPVIYRIQPLTQPMVNMMLGL